MNRLYRQDRLEWTLDREADVSSDTHEALAGLLARAYPTYAGIFGGRRSWTWARPEARMVGTADARPVAHLALLRQFAQTSESGESLLVGEVGLVAVDPDFQGRGIGRKLLAQTATEMAGLAMSFGFLTCSPAVVPFYESAGWHQLPYAPVVAGDTYTMILPLHAPLSTWPRPLQAT
ncbi:GNAT family N-acetyltransferase [Nonomuraea sp. NPDC050643]|uniref:GNAT family N-acetyltransferase n=1 Tax=Nonomuraea sp. NPDC050643 TaxID=3155660 RepID=UPI00340BE937